MAARHGATGTFGAAMWGSLDRVALVRPDLPSSAKLRISFGSWSLAGTDSGLEADTIVDRPGRPRN